MNNRNKSYWNDTTTPKDYPALNEDIIVDVAIVGGGITGITTAYLLANEGLSVAVMEASQILHGTTGHTTAKVTVQHDLIYDELIQHMGIDKAMLYYQANDQALHFIRDTVNEKQIDCDFSEEDAYIYTNTDSYLKTLEKEVDAYQKLHINGAYVTQLPFDLKQKGAIVIKNQGQFHPLKYLNRLIESFINQGGRIYEKTVAVDIEEGIQPKVITKNGHTITSKYVVIASHFPFYGLKGLYFTRMYAERSYILGLKPKTDYPGGMYISAESPKRSLRYTTDNGEKIILVAGESHKVGQGISESQHYQALERFAEQTFHNVEIKYRWSAQDLTTLDKVPYIGPITANHPNILVATGYRKWGMTNSTAASLLLKDLILHKDNPYAELFSPSRFYIDPSLKQFIMMNADVAKHFIKGKFEKISKKPENLQNNQGAVVTVDGKRAGAFKEDNGTIHVVDTTCSHLGCELEWNDAELTWDCPCHGSRFSYKGDVVEGPAEKPLEKIR